MISLFAWVDFAEEDRRRMAEVIDLFREQDTRDELGLGAIRDGLADLLFPGTSTIMTRARYFLFIPWIYQRHETKNTAGVDISRKSRADEVKLIEALVKGGEQDGVIGIEKRARLQRLASNIFWAGLGTWRILQFTGSQDQYHRSWDSLLPRRRSSALDDDKEPLDNFFTSSWDPKLPGPSDDFLAETKLSLLKGEAEYLQQKILSLGETMLGHLVSQTKPAPESEFVWTHPEYEQFPITLQKQVEHARLFSEAMHGAALIYNMLLSEERGTDELVSWYRNRYATWAILMSSREDAFKSWSRDAFWKLVESTRAHIGVRTRRFVDLWLDRIIGTTSLAVLADAPDVRDLIIERERILKRARARLGNPRALERWNGSAGSQQLNYRWHRVRVISADILRGMEA